MTHTITITEISGVCIQQKKIKKKFLNFFRFQEIGKRLLVCGLGGGCEDSCGCSASEIVAEDFRHTVAPLADQGAGCGVLLD